MKKTRLLILLSIMACVILSFAACNRTSLDKPVGLSVDEAVSRISWQNDDNAVSYTIEVNQYTDGQWKFYKEGTSDTNSYKISDLPTNINYQFRVKAISDGKTYSNSNWSDPIECFKAYESGLYFENINGDTECALVSIGTAAPVDGVIEIPSIYRGRKVTEIGNRAFFKQTAITKVIIPDTVKEIKKEAFRECKNLETVELPDSVTTMGSYAFFGCSSLKSVKLSDNMETIPTNCFGKCVRLEKIDFGTGIKNIESYAFQGCWIMSGTKDEDGTLQTVYGGLKDITFADSIETIGKGAFLECKHLENVVFGENMRTIGSEAFANNIALANVTLNKKLEVIGGQAFYGCGVLKEMIFPDTLTSIGATAFYNCIALDTIKLGTGLKEIGDSAFAATKVFNECTEDVVYIGEEDGIKWLVGAKIVTGDKEDPETGKILEGKKEVKGGVHGTPNYCLTVKDGTVGIAEGAFLNVITNYDKTTEEYDYEFSKLDKVIIPDSLKYINGGAFRLCLNLSEVELGSGVEEIGGAAFEMCFNLRLVDIPDDSKLRVIGPYAFSCGARGISAPLKDFISGRQSRLGMPLGGSGLEDMNLPDTIESIGAYAFFKTYFFEYYPSIIYVGGWAVGVATDSETQLSALNIEEVPAASTSQKPIIGISDYAFTNLTIPTEVVIPKTVKYIGIGAFSKMSNIQSISIPEGVTTINESTFYKCDSLLTVNLPESLRTIKNLAFYECGSSEDVEGVMNITGLENVTYIGDFVFYGCNRLQYADLSSELTELGAQAFTGCSQLRNIVIPDTLKEIKAFTFSNCTSLDDVTIGVGVEKIGDYAFRGTSLIMLNIPGTVKSIGDGAFRGCDSLMSVDIEEGLEEIGNYAFYGCEYLGASFVKGGNSIIIPKSVTSIGDYAFRNCVSLNSIILGDSIKSMGMHVFNKCEKLVVYTALDSIPASWNKKWNSSYRPVLYGCELSSDETYVESFVKDDNTIDNYFVSYKDLSSPIRTGYVFAGWEASDGTVYNASQLRDVPNGTKLTATWER